MTEYLVTSASSVWFNMGQDSLKPNDRIEDIVNVAIPKPLEDYCEKVDTVEMTKDEKSEFDKIKESFTSLSMAFEVIINDEDGIPYPNLYSRLFDNSNPEEDNTAQLEFSRIWEKPELIEVPEQKYNVKVPQTMNNYYYKNSYTENGVFLSTAGGENNWEEDQQFTEEEIKIWGLDMFEKEKVE